jgi:antitoxin (DNA-binding transcriptional repressor) of toxin-antitoxin stability system
MKAIEISEVAALAEHVKPGCSEPVLLTDHGRVVATIVPADEDDAQSMLLSINPKFGAILERSGRRLILEGGLFTDEVRERLGIPSEPRGPAKRSKRRPKTGRS